MAKAFKPMPNGIVGALAECNTTIRHPLPKFLKHIFRTKRKQPVILTGTPKENEKLLAEMKRMVKKFKRIKE